MENVCAVKVQESGCMSVKEGAQVGKESQEGGSQRGKEEKEVA